MSVMTSSFGSTAGVTRRRRSPTAWAVAPAWCISGSSAGASPGAPGVPRRGGRPADAELNHLYWDCGLSLRDLAGRYGLSRRAVHGWLVAAGIERRPPGAVAVVGDGDDPVGLYEGGWSCPAIADRVGCSPSTIYRRLEGAGVPRRSARPRASRHDLIEALDRGLSAPVIATHLGVSVSCVCRALAREQRETASGCQATTQAPLPRALPLAPPLPLPTSASAATRNHEATPNFELTMARLPDPRGVRA